MALSVRQRVRLEIQTALVRSAFGKGEELKILDLGTELGHTGKRLRKAFPGAIIDGVEVHKPTLEKCIPVYDSLILADALKFMRATPSQWDVIIAAELIEHLPKVQGNELLDLIGRRSRLGIVTSPIGFAPQGEIKGNPHQRHVSGWTVEEMEHRGWDTFAILPGGKRMSLGVYILDETGLI